MDRLVDPETLVCSITRRLKPASSWRYEPRPIIRGDFLYCEIVRLGCYSELDVVPGYDVPLAVGDRVILVAGERASTTSMGGIPPSFDLLAGDTIHLLSVGGIAGRMTSKPAEDRGPTIVRYLGSVIASDTVVSVTDRIGEVTDPISTPIVVITGSSAEIGKTRAACVAISALRKKDHEVVAVKLKGTGRMRDLLSYRRAGAAAWFDFVDAGLESTYNQSRGVVQAAADRVIGAASSKGSVVVAELGGDFLSGGGLEIFESTLLRERSVITVVLGCDLFYLYGAHCWFNRIGWFTPIVYGPTRRNNETINRLLISLGIGVTIDESHLEEAVLSAVTK